MNRPLAYSLLVRFFAQGLALVLAVTASARSLSVATRGLQDSPTLEVGRPLSREIKGNEEHSYVIAVNTGQFFRVVADQRSVDVVLTLYGQDGQKLMETDNPVSQRGSESIMNVAVTGGLYRLVVRSYGRAGAAGQYELKLEELRQATQSDFTHIEAQRVFGEGSSLFVRGELLQSLVMYQRALSLYQATGDKTGEAATLTQLGVIYYRTGKLEQAQAFLEQALALRRAEGGGDEAVILNAIGRIFYERGERQEALDVFTTALKLFRGVGDVSGEAATLSNLGAVYNELGETQKALEIYQRALALRRATGNRQGEAVTLNNIGRVYDDLGEKRKALEYFEQAVALSRESKDIAAEAVTLNNICTVYSAIGENKQALTYCERAVELMRQSGDRRGEAAVLINLGEARSKQGDREQALTRFSMALALFRELKDRGGEAAALNNVALLYSDRGQKRQALAYFSQALVLYEELEDYDGEAAALNNVGLLYSELGEKQQAIDYYQRALKLTQRVGDRAAQNTTLSNIGKVHSDMGEFRKALDYYLRALSLVREISNRAGEASTLTNIGAAYESLREPAQALDYYLQAIATRERLRPEAVSKGRGLSFDEESAEVYKRAALLYFRTGQPETAFGLSERMRARNLLDQLANEGGATLTVPEVQKLLPPQTTLLSYMVTADRTVAFVISANSFQAVEIPVKEEELFDLIREFRSFPTLRTWRTDELQLLHNHLVAPVERYLKTPFVGIIPHGPLHYLPFSVLTDGRRYLDEAHTLYYLPSASVIPHIVSRRKPDNSLLAVAYGRAAGMPALPFAESEVKSLAGIYRGIALTGDEATERSVQALAGNYNILHLAGHYVLNTENPLLSRLILAPGKNDDGLLQVQEIYNLNLPRTDLVVLSGSQTQLGKQTGGDDLITPSYAFIRAGASTVVGSLWKVDDEVTQRLMVSFYKHLKEGAAKAEALRKAQAETRAKYPNPYYWGAFVLTGDPGSTVRTKAAQ